MKECALFLDGGVGIVKHVPRMFENGSSVKKLVKLASKPRVGHRMTGMIIGNWHQRGGTDACELQRGEIASRQSRFWPGHRGNFDDCGNP